MTAAELKYLMAIEELCGGEAGVGLTAVAQRMNVSKVSVHRAVERLEKNGYTRRNNRNKVVITPCGCDQLRLYRALIRWISNHLQEKGNIPQQIAIQDAISAACSFSDASREFIAGRIIGAGQEEII